VRGRGISPIHPETKKKRAATFTPMDTRRPTNGTPLKRREWAWLTSITRGGCREYWGLLCQHISTSKLILGLKKKHTLTIRVSWAGRNSYKSKTIGAQKQQRIKKKKNKVTSIALDPQPTNCS